MYFNAFHTQLSIYFLGGVNNAIWRYNAINSFEKYNYLSSSFSEIVQKILADKGIIPNLAALILEKDYYDTIDELSSYEKETDLYSQVYNRKNCEKTTAIGAFILFNF